MNRPAARRARSLRLAGALFAAMAVAAGRAAAASGAPEDSAAPGAAVAPAPGAAVPRAPAVPTPQPAEWETLFTGLPEEARLGPIVGIRYNRVDGPALFGGGAVRDERERAPLLRAAAGYAFSRERLLLEFGADVPVGAARRVTVGASAYRRTASEDGWIVGETENTIFAIVARTDYRDYYEAEGFEGHVGWRPGSDAGLAVGASIEDQRPLSTRTRVAVFGADDRFRPNPGIDPGEDGVVWGSVRVGPETIPPRGGSRFQARFERSGAPLDRDFDYARLHAQGNLRRRVGPGCTFRLRALAASTRSGALPSQRIWHLGGVGTLRGEPYKALAGDQFFLANAELSTRARKNIDAFAFLDWGDAWFGRGAWGDAAPVLDGGVGFRVGEGPAAVTVARNLQRNGAPFVVGVRLGGSWE